MDGEAHDKCSGVLIANMNQKSSQSKYSLNELQLHTTESGKGLSMRIT